jgi:Flp pilus assembly protein TadG
MTPTPTTRRHQGRCWPRRGASPGRSWSRSGTDTGTLTVELVLLTPVVFALLAFVVGLGRSADAHGRLIGAARDAARAASLSRTPSAAQAAARDTALADLHGAGLECRSPQVSTDTSRFRPGGDVTVTVHCALDLSALVVSGLPGRTTLTVRATAPLDSYSSLNTGAGKRP